MIRDLVRSLVRSLIGCRHTRTVRERRLVRGREIWHFVCLDCQYVVPMISRSEDEIRVAFGARNE